MGSRIAFLDRDGTINVKAPEGDYIRRPSDLELLPGAGRAIARLNHAGYHVVLVTNQRGIALGRMTMSDYEHIHQRLVALLAQFGAHLDDAYVCPHDRLECRCRKPEIGMLIKAAASIDIDSPRDAVMIGDAASDVIAGKNFGARTIRICDQPETAPLNDETADLTAPSLQRAVDLLLDDDA